MIVEQFYLSHPENLNRATQVTGLSKDEIEEIVKGYFDRHHYRFAGLLKGQVVIYSNGKVKIKHHFLNKTHWQGELND